jgi:hypothetical protein
MTDSRSDHRIDRSSASGRTAAAGVAAANGLAQDDRAAPDSLDEPGEIRNADAAPVLRLGRRL